MALLNRRKSGGTTEDKKVDQKATFSMRPKLTVMHFQTPESLCDFVNEHLIEPVTIVAFDRFHAVYYYKN